MVQKSQIVTTILAGSVAILTAAVAGGYKYLDKKWGSIIAIITFVLLGLLLAVIAVVPIKPTAFSKPLKWIKDFVKGFYKLGLLSKISPKRIDELESRVTKFHKILFRAFPWITFIDELGTEESRTQALEKIYKLLTNSPEASMSDEGLGKIILEIAEEDLWKSSDSKEKELVSKIREATYQLQENDFEITKKSLRTSAKRMLGNVGGTISPQQLYAFDEITRHVDQWPFEELFLVIKRLREVRRSRELFEALKNGTIHLSQSFASTVNVLGHQRVWKRVWADDISNNDDAWGKMTCLVDNGNKCHGGEIEELSLCGVCCSGCELDKNARALNVKLDLPGIGSQILVRKAQFCIHEYGNYFHGDETRCSRGYSIEFLDIDRADFERLAAYIRQRAELDPAERPSNAPIKKSLM